MTRTPTQTRRLNRLASFMETLPEKLFDFNDYLRLGEKPPMDALEAGGGCGTTACAVGWAPAVFPTLLKWDMESREVCYRGSKRLDTDYLSRESHKTAMDFFGLTDGETVYLFTPRRPWQQDGRLPSDATAKQLAAHIRAFIRDGVPASFTNAGYF
jgi:hypothetical protein